MGGHTLRFASEPNSIHDQPLKEYGYISPMRTAQEV